MLPHQPYGNIFATLHLPYFLEIWEVGSDFCDIMIYEF
jgi:hypothetical protein